MKKLLLLLIAFIGLSFLTACTDCKDCRYVTKDKGTVIEEGTWATYCDEQLDQIESEEPVQVGTQTSEWECTY